MLLGAIWGGSFAFMRVLAPVLGPAITANSRLLIGGGALLAYFLIVGYRVEWRTHWRHYLIIGVVNSGIPFVLYAFAAQHIPASYSVILNSTAPLFGAVFSAIWMNDRLTFKRVAGLLLGALGVILVSRAGKADFNPMFVASVAACLLAAVCYALAGVYLKKFASQAKPLSIAGASQTFAALALLPVSLWSAPRAPITMPIVLNVLGLALLCSAVAYVLYYRLMANVGPTRALTVTFLMPAFGLLWGALFLNETITPTMIAGCLMIVCGIVAISRK